MSSVTALEGEAELARVILPVISLVMALFTSRTTVFKALLSNAGKMWCDLSCLGSSDVLKVRK